jgi:2-methylcitrate dehydratase PrpD
VDADGSALLLAVVLGYDAMGRVGEAVCLPRGGGRYFHGNGVNGVFGAAAAAGKLLGLDDQKMASALAIAGDGASGLREWAPTGADVKGLHVGRADHTGITAAYLAAAGLEGSRTVFEGRSGFLGAISPQPRPERVVMDLGTRFAVIEAGFKLYPCVGTLHLPIEAALALRREHSLDATTVDRIRIGLPAWARSEYEDRQRPPRTPGNARFSMSYVVAAALVDGEVAPRHFTAEKIADPALLGLEARAEFVTDAEADEIFTQQKKDETYFFIPCALEIDAAGRTYRRLVRRPIGYDPLERALSDEQLTAKFRLATRGILPEQKTEGLIEWTRGLDQGARIDQLDALLTP